MAGAICITPRCQAPADYLCTVQKVCGRFFYLAMGLLGRCPRTVWWVQTHACLSDVFEEFTRYRDTTDFCASQECLRNCTGVTKGAGFYF